MSIQILPPKTSISGEIGQALGPAIQKGAEQQFQRGLTQEAVGQLGNLPANASPFELAKALISATAGIPGAERYVGQLFPLLLQQMQSRAAFPPGGGPATGAQGQQGNQIPEPSGGYLGNAYSQAQIKQSAENYARQTGTGIEGYNQRYNQLLQESNLSSQRRSEIQNRAKELPEIQRRPELLPYFMKSIGKFGGETDPETLLEKGYRDFQEDVADLTKLAGRDFEKIKDFNSLAPTIQDLDKKGLGAETRKELLAKGLKPYQFSHLFNPLTQEQKVNLKKLKNADASRQFPQAPMQKFLHENLSSESPLPTIAMELYRKGYNWENIGPLMRESLGDKITQRQNLDLSDIDTGEFRFPSLTEIFRPETSSTGVK